MNYKNFKELLELTKANRWTYGMGDILEKLEEAAIKLYPDAGDAAIDRRVQSVLNWLRAKPDEDA
jgi:hypothetical protein